MFNRRKRILEEKTNTNLKPDCFSQLPDHFLRFYLFSFVGSAAKSQLAKTNHRFADFPECHNASQKLRKLLWFVLRGEKHRAEELILQDTDLLLGEDQMLDNSARQPYGTALGMALGAGDFTLYNYNGNKNLGEGMVEMLIRHLIKWPDGKIEIAKQILKQFPEGWEKQEKKIQEEDFQALNKVWKAISASRHPDTCEASVLEFQDHLKPKGVITTGKHWNLKLLYEAINMGYNKPFHDKIKNDLFYNRVIGFIQTLAPTRDAMILRQGLRLLYANQKFQRDLTYNDSRLGNYFQPALGRLGIQSWVDYYDGEPRQGEPRQGEYARGGQSLLHFYLRKNARLKQYCAAAKQVIKNAARTSQRGFFSKLTAFIGCSQAAENKLNTSSLKYR